MLVNALYIGVLYRVNVTNTDSQLIAPEKGIRKGISVGCSLIDTPDACSLVPTWAGPLNSDSDYVICSSLTQPHLVDVM